MSDILIPIGYVMLGVVIGVAIMSLMIMASERKGD